MLFDLNSMNNDNVMAFGSLGISRIWKGTFHHVSSCCISWRKWQPQKWVNTLLLLCSQDFSGCGLEDPCDCLYGQHSGLFIVRFLAEIREALHRHNTVS